MERAYKFRIYPNKTQEQLIIKTFGCARFVYNHFLNRRNELYKVDKANLKYTQCSKELTILKQEKEWLQEPDKCALQNSLKDLDNAYKNFFTQVKAGFPKFKSKHDRHKSYRTSCNIKFLGNKIQFPKLGKVRIKDSRKNIEGRILNATVSQNPDGKFYVSLCCTDIEKPLLQATCKDVGIDLGLKEFAITSDGEKFENPKYLAKSLQRLKFLQRSLSRKTKGSKNREKTRLKVARLYSRISEQRRDFLQKLSTMLIRGYDKICLENLQVSNMVKNHKLARSISDVSWSEFVRMLKYKSEWYGRKVIQIDTFYPSSQLCSVCGCKNSVLKDLSIRHWECSECGAVHDRDINAAKNILQEGLRIASVIE